MVIGNRIELNDFIDIPCLFGHKMTKIGNNLIIAGGICIGDDNINGNNNDETFYYVLQTWWYKWYK